MYLMTFSKDDKSIRSQVTDSFCFICAKFISLTESEPILSLQFEDRIAIVHNHCYIQSEEIVLSLMDQAHRFWWI